MEKNNQQPQSTSKNLLKVVFFGPESTGKTTLSLDLAKQFNTSWAPEYMRTYLQKKWDQHKEVCQIDDLIPIAEGQLQNEALAEKNAKNVVFYDTNLLQLKVYSEVYYNGFCPEKIKTGAQKNEYDLYFLLYIDIPWEADDLRDKPDDREHMFRIFEEELKQQNINYKVLKGNYVRRLKEAKDVVENLLENEIYQKR